VEFSCSHCNEPILWQAENVGRDATCPSCSAVCVVPENQKRGRGGAAESADIMDLTISRSPGPGTQSLAGLMRQRGIKAGVALDSDLIAGIESTNDEKYQVGERIAAGGMGAILDARDLNLRRHIAMKVMLNPTRVSDEKLARFIEEAQVTGQLEHPGIVPVYELGVDAEHRPFYTMKLLRGRTLHAILKAIRAGEADTVEAWPLGKLLNTFAKACEAMRYAHSRGVIHRDLKPENIMVGEFGEVQVLDWGLAKILGRAEDAPPSAGSTAETTVQSIRNSEESAPRFLSCDGAIVGTPNFMAPEQAAGKPDALDIRTDVYALGAILYSILTLAPPVTGNTMEQVLRNVGAGKIVPPARQPSPPHCPGKKIPPALAAIAMKALALEPGQRFQDVGALLADLEHYQTGFATEAEDAGVLRQLALFLKRNRTFALATALVTCAVLAGSIVSLVQWRNALAAQTTAETALGKKELAELEKQRAAKASAPAFLNAAKALAVHQQDYPGALVNARQARENDPELVEAWRLETLLQVEAGEAETALQLAEQLHEQTGGRHPDLPVLKQLRRWQAGESAALDGLANEARALEQHRLAAILSQRAGADYADQYAAMLPAWRKQLEQVRPGLGDGLTIGPRGLHLKTDNLALPNLEFLRGIPLDALDLLGYETALETPVDLSPLRGTSLRHLELAFPTDDLSPVAGPELVHLRFHQEGYAQSEAQLQQIDWSALRGNRFERLQVPLGLHPRRLDGFHIRHLITAKQEPIPELRSGWADGIRGLEILEADFNELQGAPRIDLMPLLQRPGFHEVRSSRGLDLGPTFAPALDHADPAVWAANTRAGIGGRGRWAEWTRHNLERIEYGVARRRGESPPPPDHPLVQTVGGRTFAVVDKALTSPAFMEATGMEFASIHSAAEQAAAVGFLKHLAMPDYTPRLLLAATKGADGWRWLDDTPWDFHRLTAPGVESHALVVDAAGWRPYAETAAPEFNFFADRWLVSWPASASGSEKVEGAAGEEARSPGPPGSAMFEGHLYMVSPFNLPGNANAALFAERVGARLAAVDSEAEWDFLVRFCLRNLQRSNRPNRDKRSGRNVFLIDPKTPVASLPPRCWREQDSTEAAPRPSADGLVIRNQSGRFEINAFRYEGDPAPCILEWQDPSRAPTQAADWNEATLAKTFTIGNRRFGLSLQAVSWNKAKVLAAAHGGQLATFHSNAEMETAMDHVADSVPVWVGGHFDAAGPSWRWLDGSPWSDGFWIPGEPNHKQGEELALELAVSTLGRGLSDRDRAVRSPFLIAFPVE